MSKVLYSIERKSGKVDNIKSMSDKVMVNWKVLRENSGYWVISILWINTVDEYQLGKSKQIARLRTSTAEDKG